MEITAHKTVVDRIFTSTYPILYKGDNSTLPYFTTLNTILIKEQTFAILNHVGKDTNGNLYYWSSLHKIPPDKTTIDVTEEIKDKTFKTSCSQQE